MDNNLIKEANIIARKHSLNNNKKLPTFFFFTDRKKIQDIFALINVLPSNTVIIIREYDLNYQERLIFIRKVQLIVREKSLPILIAKNLKLALEVGANGVHFTDFDKSWANYLRYKRMAKKNFLFACCCHKTSTLKQADKLGFDAIFYSPIFVTQSHNTRKPLGIIQLAKAGLKIKTALYALGGINHNNIKLLKNCKIAGIAGISFFQKDS